MPSSTWCGAAVPGGCSRTSSQPGKPPITISVGGVWTVRGSISMRSCVSSSDCGSGATLSRVLASSIASLSERPGWWRPRLRWREARQWPQAPHPGRYWWPGPTGQGAHGRHSRPRWSAAATGRRRRSVPEPQAPLGRPGLHRERQALDRGAAWVECRGGSTCATAARRMGTAR
jgi:hypothetical protein